jgi:molybdopterin/thiamine biosynthesis adenylyltransferase/rhodanese-related sulfurtransferase
VPASLSPELTPGELQRYARHLTLPHVGLEGQRRLKGARVVVVGVGGLGSPAALYLAAAGVGTIGLVDADTVELSNLQRQVLHGTSSVGASKLESAAARLRDSNPEVALVLHETRLTSANALAVLEDYDVVVDGSDNFPTRYLTNDACVLLGKPNVYGAIHRFEGQASVFWAARGPCYRCLYREPPPPGLVPSCEESGVLGVLPGIVGTIQAVEALKLVLGIGESLVGRLLVFDALAMRFREIAVGKDPACPMCGERREITGLIDYEAWCGADRMPGGEGERDLEIDAVGLDAERRAGRRLVLVDVREPFEWRICRIAGSIPIPLRELPSRLGEIDRTAGVVAVCHTGQRSLAAARFLRAAGIPHARSLRGGVEGWARSIDPTMPRY